MMTLPLDIIQFNIMMGAVLRFRKRIRWIRKILASWIRIRKNMRIHGQGAKYRSKTAKKFTLKTQI